MKSLPKIAVLALSLAGGLAGGWYGEPDWLWQQKPAYAGPPVSDSENLVALLEIDSHCANRGLASEWQWLADKILPKLLASGGLVRLAADQYQPGSRLEIAGNGSLRLPISSFGRVDAASYFEIYYQTPQAFSAVLGLFKAPPENPAPTSGSFASRSAPAACKPSRSCASKAAARVRVSPVAS